MTNLTCTCVARLDSLPAAELERLFPEPSSTAALLSLLQESGIEGFTLRSIVVSKDGAPVLLLPLFETRFDLSSFVRGWAKISLRAAGRLIPSIFQPRILCAGLLVGEWSEIGIDPQLDEKTRNEACSMAFDALRTLGAELESDLLAFYNFNHYGGLPEDIFNTYNRVECQSSSRLQVTAESMEDFLAGFSKAARKDLRRKMRASHDVSVVRSRDISPYLDRVYRLYLDTVARSPVTFGVHNRLFFEKICGKVPEAEYVLYFVQDELVAFNLLIVKKEALVDKYFCMDYATGRKYNLYVLSWLENVRTCVEQRIPFYYAGQGAEKTKAHLGAALIPGYILFRHRRPVFDRLLMAWPAFNGKVLSRLRFWPAELAKERPKQSAPPGRMEIHDQRN